MSDTSPIDGMRPGEMYEYHAEPSRYDATTLACMLGGGCITVQPWPGPWDDVPEMDADKRAKLDAIVSTPPEWKGLASLGALLVWASRRTRMDHGSFAPGDDDSAFIVSRFDLDEQLAVGGVTVNRRLVREALQPWVQQRYADCADVELSVMPHGGGHVLMLASASRSTWALVMSVRPSVARPADDPMPAHWWAVTP